MRTQHFFKTISFLAFLLFVTSALFASHNRSGEIQYKRLPPFTNSNYTYSITVIRYTGDGNGIADRCADTVYFGDGSKGVAFRINGLAGGCCPSTSSCGVLISTDQSYRVKMNVYSIVHTYTATGSYVIRSIDPNRTAGIVNIPNSDNQPFCIEAVMNLVPNLGENTSPQLTNPVVARANTGNCFYHNACAWDPDNDSLSYELTQCRAADGLPILGYMYPPVTAGGSITIDPVTGLFSWCGQAVQGIYQIAFLVKEWRRSSCTGIYQQIGYVERDMEINVVVSSNSYTFTASGYRDTCVVAGSAITFTNAAGINPSTSLSQLFNKGFLRDYSWATLTSTAMGGPGAGTWSSTTQWTTSCTDIYKIPQVWYAVFNTQLFPVPLTYYRQFQIKVVPPSPKITSAQVGISQVVLQWQAPNICNAELGGYNIYRKFGVNTWVHGPCETGVPSNSGFSFIGSTSSSVTTFSDNDLWSIPNGSPGIYLVTAVMKNCAESYADSAKAVTLIVGLNEEHLNNSVQIFPNPSSTKFSVKVQQAGSVDFTCTLYDIKGKLLKEENNLPGNQELIVDGRDLASGVYVLRIKTPEGTVYRKLIKEE